MNTTVGYVSSYKSFEIYIIENQKDSRVWIGIWEESNFNQTKLPNDDFSTIVLDGESEMLMLEQKQEDLTLN